MRSAAMLKSLLLCGGILCVPQYAHAQSGQTLEELVVTAQRREQRLQDVPLPVTAISAQQMQDQGVESTRDLVRVTPGLTFAEGGPHSMPTLRGIGSRSSAPGDSSPVALYVDGVYLPAIGAGQFEFGAIDRIEVLKGPQGTLFGRNATGGAISLITRNPGQTRSAEIEVGYADFNERSAKVYASTPINDQVRVNLDSFYTVDDGYTKDILTGHKMKAKNNYGFRSKVAVDLSELTSFIFAIDHSRIKSNQGFASTTANNSNNTVRLNPLAVTGRRRGDVALSLIPESKSKQSGISLTGDHAFGTWDLKSISAYRDSKSGGELDNDYTNIVGTSQLFWTRNKTFTQEFLATSSGDQRLGWLAGLFFMEDEAHRNPNLARSGTTVNRTIALLDTTALAPFGELTFKFSDHLTAIGGARYSYEKKHLRNYQNNIPRVDAEDSWKNLTYRLTLQYVVDPQLNFYLTNSTGFKSGAYNSTAFDGRPVDPEKVKAWSVGMKSNKFGLLFNADVFRYDYSDIQIQRAVDPVLGTALLQNAASALIKGAEVEVRAPLGDHVNVYVGATLLDAKYTSFPNADVLLPRPGGGNISGSIDATGRTLFRAPDVTLSAGANFRAPLFGGTFRGAASVYYSDAYYFEPTNRLTQPAYATVRAQVSWETPDERLRAVLFVDNLTDKVYYTSMNLSTAGDNGNYAPPRQIGVTLTYKME